DEGRTVLEAAAPPSADLAIVVADGLSARAVHEGAEPFLAAFRPHVAKAGWSLAPVVVAVQARVALGDAIGAALKARAVAVLIGERPGLSSPDSLGLYLTFDPRPGRSDAERNCISNVRPAGLAHDLAAFKLNWLLTQAFARGLTGVRLKDESDRALAGPARAETLPDA
ncbi:ethanolamine ammonia-lyase light chain EutC, partial [Methylobacterium trifolii]